MYIHGIAQQQQTPITDGEHAKSVIFSFCGGGRLQTNGAESSVLYNPDELLTLLALLFTHIRIE